MPTYTYACKKCDDTIDVFHGINATPRVKCDSCGKRRKRLIGMGSGIIFKGSGFYETDYKRKASDGKDSSSEPGKKDSGDKKAESSAKSESSTSSNGGSNSKSAKPADSSKD